MPDIIVKEKKGIKKGRSQPEVIAKVDKRKTVSRFNAFKHGRRAMTLPLFCDNCNFRPIDKGGGGQCPKYQAGAVCVIKAEYERLVAKFNTRDPEQLVDLNAAVIQQSLVKMHMALTQSAWDGGITDRVADRQFDNYLKAMKLQAELLRPSSVKETIHMEDRDKNQFIELVRESFKNMTPEGESQVSIMESSHIAENSSKDIDEVDD